MTANLARRAKPGCIPAQPNAIRPSGVVRT